MTRRAFCLRVAILSLAMMGLTACSIPTLEDPRCSDAQDRVKRFYSLYFDRNGVGAATDPATAPYLTDRLTTALKANQADETGYFTIGDRFPKSFRVGSCSVREDGQADLKILLLWRSDEKSEQRELRVATVRQGDLWFIDSVTAF